MATSLDIYRRADTPSVLDPFGRSLFADEKRQDKQQSRSPVACGRKAYLYFLVSVISQYCGAV